MNDQSILLIEDEPDLRAGLQHNLELEGFEVDATGDGKSGLRKALQGNPHLILLDLMLPGMPGLEVLQQLRAAGHATPVIIVSAKGQDRDKVAGLELGADDYITKPFALNEMMARIRAVLRRTKARLLTPSKRVDAPTMQFEDLMVDFKRYTVTRKGEETQLSRYEAEILRVLIDRRGEVVSRQDLLREVWGYVHLPTTRTVDNHIARLRKKVEEDIDAPRHVITVHGLGYRFESQPRKNEE
ncbi:MAG: response regulator transcription factor [Planctomycetota bacterium]|nr:response regulator transcription factor [Planctomycetota bacterium]